VNHPAHAATTPCAFALQLLLLHRLTTAVRPQTSIEECDANLADITYQPNISPSYCASPNPELVAEFNIFSSFGSSLVPAGTTPQFANSNIIVTLSDGRSIEVDPAFEFASNGALGLAQKREETTGKHM
jgi:hypothetical protein